MVNLNRRDFLQKTAGALAAGAAMPMAARAASGPLTATSVRTLGNTGLQCSLLGIGTGTKGFDKTSEQTRAPRQTLLTLMQYAYERGITYFDVADMYGSHGHLKEALEKWIAREKVMLLTKTWSRKPDEVRADIERFRKELGSDYLDVVLLHCIRKGEDDWPEMHKGAMDVLSEYKEKGIIKAHGVSCHNMAAFKKVAATDWADIVLARINPFGIKMDGPASEVAPVLKEIHDAGKGVLGMKILGEGQDAAVTRMRESLNYVLGLGSVDAMTIGFMTTQQMDEVMAAIEAVQVS